MQPKGATEIQHELLENMLVKNYWTKYRYVPQYPAKYR